jgi:hypothetical protein
LGPEFKQLIDLAACNRPDISPEMKELVDVITNGKILQDYFRQVGAERPKFDRQEAAVFKRMYQGYPDIVRPTET